MKRSFSRCLVPFTATVSSLLFMIPNLGMAQHSSSGNGKKMNLNLLKKEAFARCQSPFQRPTINPVPLLDPPTDGGGPASVGMTYQEELAVRTTNFIDRDGFYFSPRPRLALNTLPMDIYFSEPASENYQPVTWEMANPDFSSPAITPPIPREQIPAAGRVLTEYVIGHLAPQGGYPQLFDVRSSAYVRFNGYSPQVSGASLRLGAHRLWSLSEGLSDKTEFSSDADFQSGEDFPIIRSIYTSIKNSKTANALVLVESELFCAALSMDMSEGKNASILVDSYWYTREDFSWKKEPNTGFVAYSSMLWMTEKDTPGYDQDEAHDSDTLRVRYADGREKKIDISLPDPTVKLRVHDLSDDTPGKQVTGWSLANEDINPEHYFYFESRIGPTNFYHRASYDVEVLESSIKTGVRLFEHWTDGEYLDNIVAASTIREDIKIAKSPEEAVHFKYRTTAYTHPLK